MSGEATTGELARLASCGWDIAEHATLDRGVWSVAAAEPDEAFTDESHDLLRHAEERSVWFETRNRLIEDVLVRSGAPSSLWDIGAGNGFVSLHLQRAGIDAVAVEPGRRGARAAGDRGVRHVLHGTLDSLQLPDACLHAIGLFDVIEHLESPAALLAEVRRVVRPGGLLIVTVPAMPLLWSNVDELSGHHRRYSKRQLVEELTSAGFDPTYSNYHFAAAVAPVLALRVLRRSKHRSASEHRADMHRQLAGQSRATVALGRAVMAVERAWSRVLPVPFGTSALCVARRAG